MDRLSSREITGNERRERTAVDLALARKGCSAKTIEEVAHCYPGARRAALQRYVETGEHKNRNSRPHGPLQMHSEADERIICRKLSLCEVESALEAH